MSTLLLATGVWAMLKKLGAFGQILLGLVDSSVIPTPGGLDALTVVLAASNPGLWWLYAIAATVGSVIGAYLTYKIGVEGGREALETRVPPKDLKRIYSLSEKYGFGAILVPAILPPPVPLSPFLIAAGAMDVPKHKFLTAFSLGRFLRYGTVAYLGKLYGRHLLRFFAHYREPLLWILVGLGVVGGMAVAGYFLRRKQRGLPVFRSAKMPQAIEANQPQRHRGTEKQILETDVRRELF
jgi:membrane protein YqaA with SNARE-associated domain